MGDKGLSTQEKEPMILDFHLSLLLGLYFIYHSNINNHQYMRRKNK